MLWRWHLGEYDDRDGHGREILNDELWIFYYEEDEEATVLKEGHGRDTRVLRERHPHYFHFRVIPRI